MRKLFKERKLFKGGNYMRKYGSQVPPGLMTQKLDELNTHKPTDELTKY